MIMNWSKPDDEDHERAREQMVDRQIAGRDVHDPLVLAAMRKVPRHLFVPVDLIAEAYDDTPLPIGHGQTISQPYIVGSMTSHLAPSREKTVLEIGTGSGYQTAILAELFARVETAEIIPALSQEAERILGRLGYRNITFHRGDGLRVASQSAPFDGIIVTAAPAIMPEGLIERLAPGGRLVIPVGASAQSLYLVSRDHTGVVTTTELFPVRFVILQSEMPMS
jgi:protein-L-isoaspartate(D-aspartate) O-methyltransferase